MAIPSISEAGPKVNGIFLILSFKKKPYPKNDQKIKLHAEALLLVNNDK